MFERAYKEFRMHAVSFAESVQGLTLGLTIGFSWFSDMVDLGFSLLVYRSVDLLCKSQLQIYVLSSLYSLLKFFYDDL